MIISKSRVQAGTSKKEVKSSEKKPPELEQLLAARDYQGAIALLNWKRSSKGSDSRTTEWLAYCHFHYGEHDKALRLYRELLAGPDPDPLFYLYCSACLYYMGLFKEAEQEAMQCRLLFHIAHRSGNEAQLMQRHGQMGGGLEDQLSLAAVHFERGQVQEATDIYKRLLLEHRDFLALNVYVALCYARLDYYDVSQDILAAYLSAYPDSLVANNLHACNTFRLQHGKAAEADLKALADLTGGRHTEHDLIRHNLVVFRGGEGALQVLPPLGSLPPEARLNLVTYHLKCRDVAAAQALVKDMTPSNPQEYILKAVVAASAAQHGGPGATELQRAAQQHYQLVGSSASECDTIPGRQCMASAYFLLGQFDDVLVFLESIKPYMAGDDDFAWDYGLALAAVGRSKEAAEQLQSVRNEEYRTEPCYQAWLARCLVAAGRPSEAWDLYLGCAASEESLALLHIVANDCYRLGFFYWSAKAFDVLERLDPAPEYWEGKRGACVGALQMVAAGKDPKEQLRDVVAMLRGSSRTSAQAEGIARVVRNWAVANGVPIPA